jgi:hypothetical protein
VDSSRKWKTTDRLRSAGVAQVVLGREDLNVETLEVFANALKKFYRSIFPDEEQATQ